MPHHPSESDNNDLPDILLHRLFRIGLELHGALSMTADGYAVAGRLRAALSELDTSISELRELIIRLDPQRGSDPRGSEE